MPVQITARTRQGLLGWTADAAILIAVVLLAPFAMLLAAAPLILLLKLIVALARRF
jgi:hypothetical protein